MVYVRECRVYTHVCTVCVHVYPVCVSEGPVCAYCVHGTWDDTEPWGSDKEDAGVGPACSGVGPSLRTFLLLCCFFPFNQHAWTSQKP